MTRPRRHFTPEQKVARLREHLVDKVPVADVCEKNGITVRHFYQWQMLFFENGPAAKPLPTPRTSRSPSCRPSSNASPKSSPSGWRSTSS